MTNNKSATQRTLKVVYTGGIDTVLDKSIRTYFESLGFEWTGQGMEIETQKRDISFIK